MKFKRLVLRDFFSVEKLDLDFSKYKGITIISGVTHGAGSDSNGAGKSTIFEAIIWGLFGKTIRRLDSVKDVIRDGAKRAICIIDLEKDGRVIRVERERGSTELLKVSDLKNGTTSGTQETLEKLLGIDYGMCMRTAMFSGEMSSFCKVTQAERQVLLEKLLGIHQYDDACSIASEEVKDINIKLTDLENKIEDYTRDAERYQKDLDDLLEKHDNAHAEFCMERDVAFNDQFDVGPEISSSYSELARKSIEKIDEADNFKSEDVKWSKERDKIFRGSQAIRDDFTRSGSDVGSCQAEIAKVKKNIQKLENDEHPDFCPHCKQAWPQEETHIKVILQGYNLDLTKLDKKYATTRGLLTRAEKTYNDSLMEIKAHDMKQPEIGSAEAEYSLLGRKIKMLEIDYTSKVNHLKSLERNYWKEDSFNSVIKKMEDNLKVVNSKLKKAKEDLEDFTGLRDVTLFWKKGYSKTGIPYLLTDDAVPMINESLHESINILTDGALSVKFSHADDKKSSFVIDVDHEEGAKSYAGLSKGEHTKVDVGTMLAIRDVAVKKMGLTFEQLFYDEIFDGMDASGSARIMDLLRKRYRDTNIFMVTHDSELKSHGDNQLIMIKEDGISRISE